MREDYAPILQNPDLVRAIVHFNRADELPPDLMPNDQALRQVLSAHPEVWPYLPRPELCFDFREKIDRLLLLSEADLKPLAAILSALTLSSRLKDTVKREEVRTYRRILGRPACDLALGRGSFYLSEDQRLAILKVSGIEQQDINSACRILTQWWQQILQAVCSSDLRHPHTQPQLSPEIQALGSALAPKILQIIEQEMSDLWMRVFR